jgi:CheY-like chemotaxis protein
VVLRCLIVDDSGPFVDAARHLLERQGLSVVAVVSSGVEAQRWLDESGADVVLVDIDLGGESGFAVARQLRRNTSATAPRIILISTHAEEDYAELIAASPAVGFLAKSELSAAAVRSLLERNKEDGGVVEPLSGPRGR